MSQVVAAGPAVFFIFGHPEAAKPLPCPVRHRTDQWRNGEIFCLA
jgi:hypothetical protein